MGIFRTVLLPLLVCCSASSSVFGKQVEVHDPVMALDNGTYYAFSTGPGITFYASKDMKNWQHMGRVFATEPTWAKKVAPEFNGHLWAPDILQHNGQYYLYYSVSAFGKNTSAIGVTISPTLDPQSRHYQWIDQGIVVQSVPNRDDWNAIDPAVTFDQSGTPWMAFGSFWNGLKLVKLDPSLTRLAEPQQWYNLARRPNDESDEAKAGNGAIEAPFIFYKQGYYYLFVSFDLCCRGMDSTYHIRVGRSKKIQGPYYDKAGKSMLEGGGTLVLKGNKNWVALGHNAAYTFKGKDYMVFHAYETADNALQKLRILPIHWKQGWPTVVQSDLDTRKTNLVNKLP